MIAGLIISQWRSLALLVALTTAAAAGWTVQGWRYGERLAERDRLHAAALAEISLAGTRAQKREHERRLQLENQLQASDQSNYRKLTDAQTTNARLRDRLATAELRLSVVVDATDAAAIARSGVPAPAATGGVVDGTTRARIDPAHAQRIVSITDDGDQGLIALRACQEHARRVSANP